MKGTYVMRWPVLNEAMTLEELRSEAVPELLEQLQRLGLSFAPQTVDYRLIPGDTVYLQASVSVAGDIPERARSSLTRLRTMEHFEAWHEQAANHPNNVNAKVAA
ncbi:hypothetical protein [Nesterenkonia rhizosphaerae]|uniref:Uncharacterized protein n=1 Tax=Nesterenkonia rhizosphaerae TaxID=1348272 RepID=A0ABP9G2V8_9MICC